jgi:midasin
MSDVFVLLFELQTLLGTYVCTDIPGEFRWQAGALTQAVQQGRWALLEDLDRAPFEVLSSIVSLLERRRLFLPGRGDVVEAAPGFQLFATRSTAVRADSEHTAPVDHSQGASILEVL